MILDDIINQVFLSNPSSFVFNENLPIHIFRISWIKKEEAISPSANPILSAIVLHYFKGIIRLTYCGKGFKRFCFGVEFMETSTPYSGPYSTIPILKDRDRKSTRLNSSHVKISYAVFCLKKK